MYGRVVNVIVLTCTLALSLIRSHSPVYTLAASRKGEYCDYESSCGRPVGGFSHWMLCGVKQFVVSADHGCAQGCRERDRSSANRQHHSNGFERFQQCGGYVDSFRRRHPEQFDKHSRHLRRAQFGDQHVHGDDHRDFHQRHDEDRIGADYSQPAAWYDSGHTGQPGGYGRGELLGHYRSRWRQQPVYLDGL